MNANAPHSEINHNIDHNIDRALTALRDAQPRSGLDGRILAALEKRADEMGGLPFHAVKGWGIAHGSARPAFLQLAPKPCQDPKTVEIPTTHTNQTPNPLQKSLQVNSTQFTKIEL